MRRYMNDMKTKIACIVITTLFLMSSCSSEKEVMRSNLRTYNANHLVREINENSFDYESLQTKLDIKFKDERNSLGLKGQLRMQKDSLIWISLSMKLGIEVARVMVTDDSIKFINRSNRTYLSESLDNVKEMLPIDASMSYIQNILVGNDNQLKRSDRYKTSIDNDLYKLERIHLVLSVELQMTKTGFVAPWSTIESFHHTAEADVRPVCDFGNRYLSVFH